MPTYADVCGAGGRAPPCDDTRDYEKGGNCIWYGHTALMKEVETILILTKPLCYYPNLYATN